jgi:hypothetical protein
LQSNAWIGDIATLFSPNARLLQITRDYAAANPGVDEDELFGTLEKLCKIINNHVGVIELAEDLDIETVTEIFIRVNSAGAALSQADFAMSRIAANESYGGNQLRKAIDYFSHLAVQHRHRRQGTLDLLFRNSRAVPEWKEEVWWHYQRRRAARKSGAALHPR